MSFTGWNKYEMKSKKSNRRAEIILQANGKYSILIWNGSATNINGSMSYARTFIGAKMKARYLFNKLARHEARRRKATRNRPVASINRKSA